MNASDTTVNTPSTPTETQLELVSVFDATLYPDYDLDRLDDDLDDLGEEPEVCNSCDGDCDCSSCSGDGECTNCRGEGCASCRYSGYCLSCKGSGICQECVGWGVI